MTCSPDIHDAIAELLRIGLLQIRSAAWAGDHRLAAAIADHLHNLPGLLADYSADRLQYYWTVERPGFLDEADDEITAAYQEIWGRLEATPDLHVLEELAPKVIR